MAILSSFLPGLREVRAPLVGGYLWLLFIWLLADPAAPHAYEHSFYGRLQDIADATGSVGHAIAASIAAYLIGSLVTSLVLAAVRRANAAWSMPSYWPGTLDDLSHEENQGPNGRELPLDDLLLLAGVGYKLRFGRTDKILLRSVEETVDRELGESFQVLQASIGRGITSRHRPSFRFIQRMDGGVASFDGGGSERLAWADRTWLEIPRFSIARDLYREFPILRTRLTEHSLTTGGAVERLHAEAEFRLAVAAPLFALVVLFATTDRLWLIGLIAPLALLLQGFSLERQGNRQLVDALRARSGTEDLEQITPVFARYRTQAQALAEALDRSRPTEKSSPGEGIPAGGSQARTRRRNWKTILRRR